MASRRWGSPPLAGSPTRSGGSWLAVPAQSKHPKEAADLVKFLTSPEGQIGAFKAANNLPSSPQALSKQILEGRNASSQAGSRRPVRSWM